MSEYHCWHCSYFLDQSRRHNTTDTTDDIATEQKHANRSKHNVIPFIKVVRNKRLGNECTTECINCKQNAYQSNCLEVLRVNTCKIKFNFLFGRFCLNWVRVANHPVCDYFQQSENRIQVKEEVGCFYIRPSDLLAYQERVQYTAENTTQSFWNVSDHTIIPEIFWCVFGNAFFWIRWFLNDLWQGWLFNGKKRSKLISCDWNNAENSCNDQNNQRLRISVHNPC